MFINRFRVKTKLWLVTTTVFALVVALAAGVILSIQRDADHERRVVREASDGINIVTRWYTITAGNLHMTKASMTSTDAAVSAILDAGVKENIGAISAMQKELNERLSTETDKRLMEDVAVSRKQVLDALGRIGAMKKAGQQAEVVASLDGEFMPLVTQYLKLQAKVVDEQVSKRERALVAAEAAQSRSLWIGVVLLGAMIVVGVLMVRALVNGITAPLRQAVDVAEHISKGDLSQRIEVARTDEFGELLRALEGMNRHLHGLVSNVREGVESVFTASSEIAQGNMDLSTRTEQTAASLQDTSSRMAQLTEALGVAADTAQQADALARDAAQAAGRGGEVVGQAVQSMTQISDSSKRIADITGIIDGIAFQTNILALNAAVEAARAGEQGRGFAVVASEVRSLAQRSATAAREIKELIGTSVRNIESGSEQVNLAGESMHEIVRGVERVTALMGEITRSTLEQRRGVGEVHDAVGKLDDMTQRNAALVEESAAAASSMRTQAERLNGAVAVFRLGNN